MVDYGIIGTFMRSKAMQEPLWYRVSYPYFLWPLKWMFMSCTIFMVKFCHKFIDPRNYIGIAVLLYYTLSSTRSAGLFATNKAKPSIAQRSTVRRKYWQMHADILPDFDLAIQPRFTAENVNKSLPPFLYSSLF